MRIRTRWLDVFPLRSFSASLMSSTIDWSKSITFFENVLTTLVYSNDTHNNVKVKMTIKYCVLVVRDRIVKFSGSQEQMAGTSIREFLRLNLSQNSFEPQ